MTKTLVIATCVLALQVSAVGTSRFIEHDNMGAALLCMTGTAIATLILLATSDA